MTDQPEFQPCRTTRHCATHDWCHRCDPEFSAVMDRVNGAIQHTDPDSQHWGPLYGAIASFPHAAPAPTEEPK
ncbi:hypothetical protein E6R18_25275 [Streptomyces sp. A1277]|uniref:hypothetical protein n=1 Tax=Streptomyces sp. A1277 TaxID=2563103 RepID=UPI0010A26E28|nr:hypothetical protein [Streptomyces sp. A1277]THA29220.1 hypothetical protein E6R18_25275 [Streptomyces sp. A1277]